MTDDYEQAYAYIGDLVQFVRCETSKQNKNPCFLTQESRLQTVLEKSRKATPAMQLRRNRQDSHISQVRSQLRKGL